MKPMRRPAMNSSRTRRCLRLWPLVLSGPLLLGACNALDDPKSADDTAVPIEDFGDAFPSSGSGDARPVAMPDPGLTNFGTEPVIDPSGFAPPPVPATTPPELPCDGFGFDNDGLSEAEEEDAGLDVCSSDTDDDGCPDVLEYYAGGCDDRGVPWREAGCWC